MHTISKYVASHLGVESEQGVTTVELGLVVAWGIVAVAMAVSLVGQNLPSLFSYVAVKVAV